MPAAPEIQSRAEQPYAAIVTVVTMQSIANAADRIGDVFGWLAERGIALAGPPFLKYNVIDMMRDLEIEAGIPIAAAVESDGEVRSGILPAGRYATLTHIGHPSGLVDATTRLLAWTAEQGLRFDVTNSDRGEHWGCRLESYRTDPREQPDMNQWETELAFRLAD